MKRIGLYLGCHPYGGGTFQYCQTILDALYELKKEGKIEVFVVHENFDWEKHLTSYRFSSVQAPKYFIFKILLKIWKMLYLPILPIRTVFDKIHPLIQEFKKHRCDVWIFPSQDQWPIFISSLKTIATIHDLMHRYESQFPEVGNEKEFKNREFLYSNLCKYANTILVDSFLGKKQVTESYGTIWESKIKTLHYIVPKALTEIKPDLEVLKKRQLDDSFFIFYPAQFWKHKNHINLLKAFKTLEKMYPHLSLILSGSAKNGSEEIDLFIQANNLTTRVHILGYVNEEELAGLYMKAQAMVMPTFFGPTNIPPLEAEYFGCPLVYSNIYAANELIKSDNVALINPNSPDSIAEGIQAIISQTSKNRTRDISSYHNRCSKFKNSLAGYLGLPTN